MPILEEFTEAQLFFLVFLLLSLPVFLYFYFRGALETAVPEQYSFDGRPPAGTPGAVNRTLEPIAAPDEGPEPLPAPAAPAAFTSVPGDAEPRTGPMARSSHAPVAHDVAILPWHKDSAVQQQEPPEFSEKPEYWVPGGLSFRIMVRIECLLDDLGDETALPAGAGKFGALVAEIGQGEEVGLFLECLSASQDGRGEEPPVDIDARYQALPLGPRPATVIFVARSMPVESEAKARMSLWIMSGAVKLGAIDFEIAVYPSAEAVI